jgi:hypothetical protein
VIAFVPKNSPSRPCGRSVSYGARKASASEAAKRNRLFNQPGKAIG